MKISIQRIISGVVLVALLIVIVPAVSYVSTVFGWTNPIVNPPGGAGAIMVDPVTGNVGVAGPTASTTLTVNGEISVSNNRIRNLTSPIDGNDAVNKDYLLAAGGGGGGSLVLFYKTINDIGTPSTPTCPSGWNTKYTGYGPHFIGVFNYDWLYTSGGASYEGGFGGGGSTGSPPPAAGSSYILKSVSFGSDSVCSTSAQAVIPSTSFYSNIITTGYTTMHAEACSIYQGNTHCNRCLVCEK